MATLSHAGSRRMYSWWWDSHISPKNSKWLQENLTDVDAKVKAMIKLIEEDADSFARRAEMYYKKRPELMKLVEELYRAYRALAERYDHATGALRQAQRSIAEAFPNQVPFALTDDSPISASSEAESFMPGMRQALFDPDESNSVTSRKGLKQLNDLFESGEAVQNHPKFAEGRLIRGLNFEEENEIQTLKDALVKLEAEKEANLARYEQSLERVSNLELELSNAQKDSKGFTERARKAEADVQALTESLNSLETEREASLLKYQQCLDTIHNLENSVTHAQEDARGFDERASKAELETQSLKHEHSRVEAEKEALLSQHKQSLELISNLECKLVSAEEVTAQVNERADKAESEVENLKRAFAMSNEEKDATALQCQQNKEKISDLQREISCMQEDVQRLNGERDVEIVKLKDTEECCHILERSNQILHSDLGSMVLKMGTQGQELMEKQKEVGRLWSCLQEERLRFMEVETSFQNLQLMHSHSQEELRSLTAELQNCVQILKDMEVRNRGLQDEVQLVKEENRSLNELNLSSTASIQNMQDEISRLRERKVQLEEEVGLRVDQRNALQQEIYCLKEELNDSSRKLRALTDQVNSVGLNPECLASSVKELQHECSKLKEICEKERSERVTLLEKLELLDNVLEKNRVLENSLSDLSAELEGFKGKLTALEESCQSLVGEKLALVAEKGAIASQLQIISQNFEKSSEKNGLLENSLSDAHAELEGLREKLKSLESSCQLLDNERSGLITERDSLATHFEITQQRLEDLENKYTNLEERHSVLENNKESVLLKLDELSVSLDAQKEEHAQFTQSSETRLTSLEAQILLLQEEGRAREKELEEGLHKAVNSQIEIFILRKCIEDLEEKNLSLLIDCEKFIRVSKSSEKLISELEHENLEQQMEVKSLNDHIRNLRMGMSKICQALDIDSDYGSADEYGRDQLFVNRILGKFEDTRTSLRRTQDENQQLVIENSVFVTLLGQLKEEAVNLEARKNTIAEEFKIITAQLSVLQNDAHKIRQINENLTFKLSERDQKEKLLTDGMEDLNGKLLALQGAYQDLKSENFKVLEEKSSLLRKISDVEEQNHSVGEENCDILGEAFYQSNLSMMLMNAVSEKLVEQNELSVNLTKLHGMNSVLEERVNVLEGDLEMLKLENFLLKESLEKSENELKTEKFISVHLNQEIADNKDLLCQKGGELLKAEEKLIAMQIEQTVWHKTMEDLEREYHELMVIREDQEQQILKQAQDIEGWNKENECLYEATRRMEDDLCKLHKDSEATKIREDSLVSELENGKSEVELWQNEATALFGELQASAVHEALFEEKLRELCERFQDQRSSKDMEVNLLNERVSTLEGENGGLKSQLASYVPAIAALKDSITSLESHTILHLKLDASENVEAKDIEGSHLPDTEMCQKLSQDQISKAPYGFPDLQILQTRIVAAERSVMEMERVAGKKISEANVKLEAAKRQIDELQSQSNSSQKKFQSRNCAPSDDLKLLKPTPEISEVGNELLTKDIMLDQMSKCSSYSISKRENVETADPNKSIDLTAGKAKNAAATPSGRHRIGVVEGHPDEPSSLGIMVEKELGVDILEISKSFREQAHQGGNKRKVLERLASDAQKLTNLGITVQDLKRKVEITEKSKKGKGIEYDTAKVQLEEAEEAIQKLFNTNEKLMKNVDDNFSPPNGKTAVESEESGSVTRRRIYEQARRASEKIGRLQLELQKIQFILLKLDDEKERKARIRIPERKTRVVLRDYLYGAIRTNNKQKKAHCCSCIQPPTTGD